jgi:VanZ like family
MLSLPLRRLLFAALLLTILLVCVMPAPPRLPGALGWDKLQHLAAFGTLALTARWAWPRAAWGWIWLGLFAYGIGIEWAQSFTPNRVAEAQDVVADLLGVGLGHLLGWAWQRRQQAR